MPLKRWRKREDIILQSKGGILSDERPVAGDGILGPRYEFSKDHIIASVDAELSRLNTDYLDVFLLHRPDALVNPKKLLQHLMFCQQLVRLSSSGFRI